VQKTVYDKFVSGKLIVVTGLVELAITTLADGITVHEYEVGALLAEALNVWAREGAEHTVAEPIIGSITGTCAKILVPDKRHAKNKR
jgi:hypothetical protein